MNTDTASAQDNGFHSGSVHVSRAGAYVVTGFDENKLVGEYLTGSYVGVKPLRVFPAGARAIEEGIDDKEKVKELRKAAKAHPAIRRQIHRKIAEVSSGDYWTEAEEDELDRIVSEIIADPDFEGDRYIEAAKRLDNGRSWAACRFRYELLHSDEYATHNRYGA